MELRQIVEAQSEARQRRPWPIIGSRFEETEILWLSPAKEESEINLLQLLIYHFPQEMR